MTENATRVKSLVDEVNLGSQEQARGMEQISRVVLQMEQVTQKTAASAEESASAGTELNDHANTLARTGARNAGDGGGGVSEGRGSGIRRAGDDPGPLPSYIYILTLSTLIVSPSIVPERVTLWPA